MSTSPNFLFIDVILLAYRLGEVRHEEQKEVLLAAARSATDGMTFLSALENYGVGRQSRLYSLAGKVLAAPDYYRTQYARVLGLRSEGEQPESFLGNQRVLGLTEAVLTTKQQRTMFEAYWWFVHNHEATFVDPKRGHCIGAYATDPRDNVSTLERFESFLLRMQNHRAQRVRERYASFPVDIVIAILKRAFI